MVQKYVMAALKGGGGGVGGTHPSGRNRNKQI